MSLDERFEPLVEVGGQSVGQGGVVGAGRLVHQPMKHHAAANGCIRSRDGAPGRAGRAPSCDKER